MRVTFEPGDGSFEIILDKDEKLPAEWNRQGVTVWRDTGKHRYILVKSLMDGDK